jgi:hypothetical protein
MKNVILLMSVCSISIHLNSNQELKGTMKDALDAKVSPLNASVELIFPGVIDMHQTTQIQLATLYNKINSFSGWFSHCQLHGGSPTTDC